MWLVFSPWHLLPMPVTTRMIYEHHTTEIWETANVSQGVSPRVPSGRYVEVETRHPPKG
ncbi:unnamed protein product [Penicillium camemberti]|uniref:Str. FM013 n=1 Tax=Penicillium camemberti (strain FM 013) TaxID=1429867 RepID=A0A0G4P0I0_PENC3|nr:unnamed protein product [Penicillium camemberti]